MSAPDFPFFDGRPIALSWRRWVVVLLAVVAGFAALYLPVPDGQRVAAVLPAVLFPLLPLLALRAVAGPHWRALFARVGRRDVALAVGVALLNIAVTAGVAVVVSALFGAAPNPAMRALSEAGAGDRLLFLLQTLPQLLGEELLTVLPFLAVLAGLHRSGVRRRTAIVAAWGVSALVFGLAHLPTYDWHVAQCLLIIGSARLVLSLAYLRTRNLWVPTIAHVVNDWLLFGAVLLLEQPLA